MSKLLFVVIFLCLSLVFVKNALHMFQQNRYEIYRYTKWLFNKRNIHFSWALVYILVVVVFHLLTSNLFEKIGLIIINILFAIFFINKESKKEYVKELVFTARVKRQVVLMAIFEILLAYILVSFAPLFLTGIIMIYAPYLLIYLLYIVSEPIERGIKKIYENKARKILDDNASLVKVGITGSFGKTTTKNIVSDIIGESFYTLMTPASYNTPMGITRTIREYLKPIHEVFVCEMGADHVGEITYLMDFVKPRYGIVTTIGPQHLNTFHSMENIIKEKMEMIEKLPIDGVGIINIDNEYINNYQIKNTCKIVTVGIENKTADYVAENIKYNKTGSSFSIKIKNKTYKFKTLLLGKHNIMNLLTGIALALEMGIEINKVVESVELVKRVEHRLELKKISGLTFIDNAFNSNPVGCKASLDVLEMMSGKRVIVTPGLIDLGDKENQYNYEFGAYMKDKTDFVILVGEKNSEYIKRGLIDSKYDMENVLIVKSVKEAFNYVYSHFTNKDTILLENDLPDAFLY